MATENAATAQGQQSKTTTTFYPYNKNSVSTRKLRAVQVMQQQIRDYVEKYPKTIRISDFSKAAVAIIREARQLPDNSNNLQKRYSFKLSPMGPNPNGQHTV